MDGSACVPLDIGQPEIYHRNDEVNDEHVVRLSAEYDERAFYVELEQSFSSSMKTTASRYCVLRQDKWLFMARFGPAVSVIAETGPSAKHIDFGDGSFFQISIF